MKRFALFIICSLFTVHYSLAQQPDVEGSLVKWMTLKEAMEKTKTAPRPIVMDFYTDWCGWCKRMMATTYTNPGIAQYINTNFYPVKFNAEGKDTIEYLGQKYQPVSDAPRTTHPLAMKLLQGKLMYPTTLFLNNFNKEKNEFNFSMTGQGYLDNTKLEPMLVYTLENAYRNSGYDDFKVQFDKAFYDTTTDAKLKKVLWQKPAEFFSKHDSTKKKTMVMVHTDWCNACKVMYRTSFIDSTTEKYIREKFELVDFNPEMTDAVKYKGQTFINAHSPQFPFHQLAVTLCNKSLTLPTLVILNENMTILDDIPFYLNPAMLKNIATFYGDNIYKTKSWTDFMKTTGETPRRP